eukprot:m.26639 g.26639  ORF g.26639 m.26639 type:complete len:199 (-) comp9282_c0_seq1:98-694(-)
MSDNNIALEVQGTATSTSNTTTSTSTASTDNTVEEKSDGIVSYSIGGGVVIRGYKDENDLPRMAELIARDLSEPYSVYTYRYFLHTWPQLSHVAVVDGEIVGTIICRLSKHKRGAMRGYIAMIAVDEKQRRKGIGTALVEASIAALKKMDADEITLEAEVTNKGALRTYEKLGFLRDKLLYRYYLSGVSAWRLKLWLK